VSRVGHPAIRYQVAPAAGTRFEGGGGDAVDAVADAEAVAAHGTEIVIPLPAKLLSGLQVERR
jgi:hypothetical protein